MVGEAFREIGVQRFQIPDPALGKGRDEIFLCVDVRILELVEEYRDELREVLLDHDLVQHVGDIHISILLLPLVEFHEEGPRELGVLMGDLDDVLHGRIPHLLVLIPDPCHEKGCRLLADEGDLQGFLSCDVHGLEADPGVRVLGDLDGLIENELLQGDERAIVLHPVLLFPGELFHKKVDDLHDGLQGFPPDPGIGVLEKVDKMFDAEDDTILGGLHPAPDLVDPLDTLRRVR